MARLTNTSEAVHSDATPAPLADAQRQKCKACGCADKFDFHVPDAIWNEIVPAQLRNNVVCLSCFDKFAFEKQVDYAGSVDVLYFAGDRAIFKFETVSAAAV